MGNKCFRLIKNEGYGEESQVAKRRDSSPPAVDWDDEMSVHHHCAMNSLHNYALGRMEETLFSDTPTTLSRHVSFRKFEPRTHLNHQNLSEQRSDTINISFADVLEQTFHFERAERSSIEYGPANIDKIDVAADRMIGIRFSNSTVATDTQPGSACENHEYGSASGNQNNTHPLTIPICMDSQQLFTSSDCSCLASTNNFQFPGPADSLLVPIEFPIME
jgi:hypothetical protein